MNMILGMDIWVFMAWILTILSALICVLYGIYNWFVNKKNKNNIETKNKSIKQEEN